MQPRWTARTLHISWGLWCARHQKSEPQSSSISMTVSMFVTTSSVLGAACVQRGIGGCWDKESKVGTCVRTWILESLVEAKSILTWKYVHISWTHPIFLFPFLCISNKCRDLVLMWQKLRPRRSPCSQQKLEWVNIRAFQKIETSTVIHFKPSQSTLISFHLILLYSTILIKGKEWLLLPLKKKPKATG